MPHLLRRRRVAIGFMTYSSPGELKPWQIAAPLGFVQFFCVKTPKSPDQVAFGLNNTIGDALYLYDTDRATVIDSVQFGPLPANVSQGRLPDGGDTFAVLPKPTPKSADSERAVLSLNESTVVQRDHGAVLRKTEDVHF